MKKDLGKIWILANVSWLLGVFLVIIGDVSFRWDDIGHFLTWVWFILFFLISLPLYTIIFFES